MLTERFSHSGRATYFYQNGNAGSCGQYHSGSDYIVAVSPAAYTVSNHCRKQVTITNTETGITTTATVADSCYGANNQPCPAQNLDLSVGLWKHLHGSNNLDEGEFSISWHFD
jgi:hypothetical protein